MNYIYHIYAGEDKSTLYIGQSSKKDSGYTRALQHFSGAWGRSKGWVDNDLFGNTAYENPKFQEFMLSHALDEMTVEIYDDAYFGIPKKDFERFATKWITTYNSTLDVRQQQREDSATKYTIKNTTKYSDNERLNIAEIMHIYYYGIQMGCKVLAMSMGGQNYATLSTEGNILNREMSPEQMQTVIERGSTESFQKLQEVFTKELENELEKSKQDDNLYEALSHSFIKTRNSSNKSLTKKSFSTIIDQWLSRHLKTIIHKMQKVSHTADGFRIQWPKDYTKMAEVGTTNGTVNSLIQAITIALSDNKNKLNAALAKGWDNLMELIENIIEQKVAVGIGIANLIKIKPLSETTKVTIVSKIKNGKIITGEESVTNTLKHISYNFFRRCANIAKSEISATLGSTVEDIVLNNHFRKTIKSDNEDKTFYKIVSAETFYNKIREIYKEFGIKAHFMNINEWPNFCRGMLTVYTKNNGTVVGGPLEMYNVEGMFLGTLGSYEYEDKIIIPAYEFTLKTYNFVEQNDSMKRDDLTIY